MVNFTVRYATGGTDTVPTLTMIASEQLAETVATLWPATANQRGMIEVKASAPIGLVAFRFQGAALTLIDTIPPTAGGTTPILSTIAHSADGNNFKSTFVLTNTGTTAAPYTLGILNTSGQTQTFGFDVPSPLSGTVPAGSTLTIDTTGLGSVTNLGGRNFRRPRSRRDRNLPANESRAIRTAGNDSDQQEQFFTLLPAVRQHRQYHVDRARESGSSADCDD